MKLIAKLMFALALLPAGMVHAQEQEIPPKAQAATLQWLKLADAGEYAATWEQAAGLFKTAVAKVDWERAVQQVREQLGKVTSREPKASEFRRSMPGVPDGEYVVSQFDTRFEHKADAEETVTVRKDEDGVWRVAGYYVK